MGKVAKEAISLLVDLYDPSLLIKAVSGMEAVEVAAWIPSLEEDSVQQLHSALLSTHAPCKGVVSKELAQRLASLLSPERVKSLWQLLLSCADIADDPADSWMQAAACFLCAHLNRLQVSLPDLSSPMLTEAAKFMDDQSSAIAFAKSFFKYDLGISAFDKWPIKSTAGIVLELARKKRPAEKLQLLLKGHRIDESNMQIRMELAKQLHYHILRDGASVSDMEGLFLKLTLKESGSVEGSIPENVLSKLTLEERHLKQASPQQLINLSQLLGRNEREADGARVAMLAGEVFAATGKVRESEDAYLTAFEMDHCNKEIGAGLAQAVRSAHQRCEELEAQCRELSEGLAQAVKSEHERFEETVRKAQAPRLELGSSLVWELWKYDFTKFTKNQSQLSKTFQLPCGVNAWLDLEPKGHSNSSERMAALFLWVDQPALVKWTWQSNTGNVVTMEHNFCKDLDKDGKLASIGRVNFMPISETKGSITVRILSVRLPGSELRLQGPEDRHTELGQGRAAFNDKGRVRLHPDLEDQPRHRMTFSQGSSSSVTYEPHACKSGLSLHGWR